MVFGMTTFTWVHVAIGIAGIASGLVVFYGLIAGKPLDARTALFPAATAATSVTSFFFPFERFFAHACPRLDLAGCAGRGDQHNEVATASLLENRIDEAERRTWFLSEIVSVC